jgi:hypothetical protein
MGMRLKQALRSVFVGLAVMAASGCDDILAGLSNTYTGPPPSREDITNEIAVIRRVRAQPETGDRIRITTRFLSYRESGELGRYVSDWPYDKYDEYPIGFHTLTSVERLAP